MVLTSDELGAGNTIEISESGGNFLAVALDQFVEGVDAKFTIDGVSLTRSSNDFSLDGITYSFNDTTSETAKVTITQDTDSIYENISNFVNDYNTLIDTINGVVSEEYDYDYPPLTDDQKAEMDDDEIEAWEAKAKTGILANDSLLQDMLDKLRSALVEGIDGLSTSIYSIGISPSSDYSDKGKLEIDVTELKAAIEADPEAIMKLFTKQSEDYSGTTTVRTLSSSARATRYQEEGLSYRFYDIIQDYVGTIRDSAGNKGLLLEKAGTEDDTTETDNAIIKQLEDYAERIEAEEERLDDYEESLYEKYTSLETYMSNMNTQLNALLSMFES
jgi:flagellar hook-associated protein 2